MGCCHMWTPFWSFVHPSSWCLRSSEALLGLCYSLRLKLNLPATNNPARDICYNVIIRRRSLGPSPTQIVAWRSLRPSEGEAWTVHEGLDPAKARFVDPLTVHEALTQRGPGRLGYSLEAFGSPPILFYLVTCAYILQGYMCLKGTWALCSTPKQACRSIICLRYPYWSKASTVTKSSKLDIDSCHDKSMSILVQLRQHMCVVCLLIHLTANRWGQWWIEGKLEDAQRWKNKGNKITFLSFSVV
jgi:hypothetical protein